MTQLDGSSSSRSFVDLSIFNCAGVSKAVDADSDEMKDLRSFTGVCTPYRIMAVSPNGKQLLFKRSNQELYLYDTDDIVECSDLKIIGVADGHKKDTIFEVAFLTNETICLILQGNDGTLYIAKAVIDRLTKSLIICTPTTCTQIICRKHYSTSVIIDENGAVLISYPLSFRSKPDNEPPKISLLHLTDFYARNGVRMVTVQPNVRDKKALYCDPFIHRNCVYLFNRFESTILCVAISGIQRGSSQTLSTFPDPKFQRPNSRFANKSIIVLNDLLLVYCHQRLDKPHEEPQLWILQLRTMSWHRLQLILNHHYPIGLVSLQRAADESLAFLHGECARTECLEKVHLYQLSLSQECLMPCGMNDSMRTSMIDRKSGEGTKRSSSTVDIHRLNRTIDDESDEVQDQTPTSSQFADTTDDSCVTNAQAFASPRVPPTLRYIRKNREKNKRLNTSNTSNTTTSEQTSRSQLALSSQATSQNENSYVHWSEEMAEEGGALTISEQLRLAKDMGYSDDEIMQAISMNCAKDGSYRAFSSTNAMIDMLARVQRMYDSSSNNKGDSAVDDFDRSPCSRCLPSQQTPSTNIRRAISFHSSVTPTRRSPEAMISSSFHDLQHRNETPKFQLQRLLDAFEKEQKSFNEESTRSIRALEERCRQFADSQAVLKVRLLEKDSDIQALKIKLQDRSTVDEQLRSTKAKLEVEILEMKSKTDQISVLTTQAELFKLQHDKEINEKDKLINELFSKVKAAEIASKPIVEKNDQLNCEIDKLKQQLAKKEADLNKCENYYDEMRKAEQLIEQIRSERDEVRSTLNKIPTCAICLDKRPQILYMPCSHFICCEDCGSRFDHCPACRKKICGKITAYQ